MDTKTFLDNFGHIADARNGVQKLRELILELGIEGRLGTQNAADESAEILFGKIERHRDSLIKTKKIRKQASLPEITEEVIDFVIPGNWKWVRFGDLGDWGAGSTPGRKLSEYYDGEIPWFKSGELTGGVITKSEETVTNKALAECSLRLNQPGDVLIAMYGATIGKVAIMGVEGTTNQAVCACTCFNGLDNKFMLLLLKAYKSRFVDQGAGGAQPNISRVKIVNTVAPLPPLEEQKRIIAKVDQLMALCDQLETQQKQKVQTRVALNNAALDKLLTAQNPEEFNHHWQRIANNFHHLYNNLENLSNLRGTVLQLAIQGALVPQNPNDEVASELLGKIELEKERLVKEGKIKKGKSLSAINMEDLPFDLPEGWAWVHLQDIFGLITDGDHQAPPKSDTGVPFLVIGNLNTGKVNFSGCRFVPQKYYDNLDWGRQPSKGDILYTVTGSYGIPISIDTDTPFCVQRHVAIFKATSSTPIRYLSLFLESKYAYDYAANIATGIAQKTVPLTGLRKFLVPIPPASEQFRLVAKVDQLMALCDQLETKLKQTQTTSGNLVEATVKSLVAA